MSRLTVLYVNHTARVSGGELSLLDLLRHVPERIRPVVACPPGELARRVTALGVRVVAIPETDLSLRLGLRSTTRGVVQMVRMAGAVRRAAARVGAGLIHANSLRAGLVAVAGGVRGGPPLLVHARDRLPDGRLTGLILRLIARRAQAIVGNSAFTVEPFLRAGGRATTTIVHSPVDLRRFRPVSMGLEDARRALGVEADTSLLAVVGQLTPWKAQDDAIRATAILAERIPEIVLLVVGSAKFTSADTRYDNVAYEARLHELVASLRVTENVRFLGERQDVEAILVAADLVLVPSWSEPFGRVVIEAMAMGTPVMATDRGGPTEIITPGIDGFLLRPRDPQRWADGAEELLRSPDLRARVGGSARKRAQAFSVERHADALLAVYEATAVS